MQTTGHYCTLKKYVNNVSHNMQYKTLSHAHTINNTILLQGLYLCTIVPQKALAVSVMQFGGVVGKLTIGNLSTWLIQKDIMKVCIIMSISMNTLS